MISSSSTASSTKHRTGTVCGVDRNLHRVSLQILLLRLLLRRLAETLQPWVFEVDKQAMSWMRRESWNPSRSVD